MLTAPGLGRGGLLACALAGALGVLVMVLSLGRRAGYAPSQMLLVGAAVTAMLGAIITVVQATGDPRVAVLLTWLSGSTYNAGYGEAAFACGLALAMLALGPLVARWLEILPLGPAVARAVGVDVGRARLVLLLFTATLTGAATLVIGPLSFIGLMAPHMARMVGLHRPMPQLATAGLLGALILVTADWIGRMIVFPWQIPAGLVATGLGGAYFIGLTLRR